MKNAPRTWLAVLVLVVFAILAVRQLTDTWTHNVPLSVDLTSLYIPPPLSVGNGELLDRATLSQLSIEIQDESGVTQLSFATSFRNGLRGSLAFHCTASSGDCVVAGTATFILPSGEPYEAPVQGTFHVEEKNRFHLSSGSEEVDGRPNLDHHRTMESTRKSSTVAVFSGGPTDEHPISIETGKAASRAIQALGHTH